MYQQYTVDPSPEKRRVINSWKTADEAAKDLGLEREQLVRLAAQCKQVWNSPRLGQTGRKLIVLAVGNNKAERWDTKERAYRFIEDGIMDPDELAQKLGIGVVQTNKYIRLYKIDHTIPNICKKKPPNDAWTRWFTEEWGKMNQIAAQARKERGRRCKSK